METQIQLTDEQRKTLVDAEQILIGLLREKNESLLFSLHCGWKGISVTYFTPHKEQHGSVYPFADCTLADKMQEALNIRAAEDARPDHAKTARIERLRKEIAELTGEAA